MAKMTLKMLKLLPDNEMNVAGMLEWRRNEPKELSFDDHVTGAQTNLRRTARPVIRLRPKFRHEIQVEAEHEGRQSDRSESLSGWPQRLRGQSEGREEAEADGANEDARQVAQKRGVRYHDLQETWIKKVSSSSLQLPWVISSLSGIILYTKNWRKLVIDDAR